YVAEVRSFFHGNEFYLLFTETFRDVRLVGAPPSSIGKFGGDTDNWMWPRHTGDFALFRIYACKNNKPADYSPDNVPYTPERYLTISLQGVEQNDFTFVIGYPGRTNQYLPAAGLENIVSVINPATIKFRSHRLEAMNAAMKYDPKVRIQYASKHASIANGWKRLIGENRGLKRHDAINRKREQEQQFTQWVQAEPERQKLYGNLIQAFTQHYQQLKPWSQARTFLNEAGLAIEIVRFAHQFHNLVNLSSAKPKADKELADLIAKLKSGSEEFFKNYHPPIDRKIMADMLRLYHQHSTVHPEIIEKLFQQWNGDFEKMSHHIFNRSIFNNQEELMKLLVNYHPRHRKRIENDPTYQLAKAFFDFRDNIVAPAHQAIQTQIDSLQRIYMQALMKMQPEQRFYPDANLTLRVTYGKVEGYYPRDAVYYSYYTTLTGKMEKENPDDNEFVVEEKLKELYHKRNFGRYADANGEMRLCFIASNHTSGGNSGSPVLNAYGHLVGINFDRVWEGTMSDLFYDVEICRNISLDIRYCLFVIEKFAGAGHLLEEMTILP
ncbi:MAG TPA: S46 family peptidase, partial [Bacteroidales bacterium]|nr:S46 family peptidase [Bacteroidales bacterium]